MFIQIIKRFYNNVNKRLILELALFKKYNEDEIMKHYDYIFKLVVSKVNNKIGLWYTYLWLQILKENKINVSEYDKIVIENIYKDIESKFLSESNEVKSIIEQSRTEHAQTIQNFKTDLNLEFGEILTKYEINNKDEITTSISKKINPFLNDNVKKFELNGLIFDVIYTSYVKIVINKIIAVNEKEMRYLGYGNIGKTEYDVEIIFKKTNVKQDMIDI